jgi:hypothetical protein
MKGILWGTTLTTMVFGLGCSEDGGGDPVSSNPSSVQTEPSAFEHLLFYSLKQDDLAMIYSAQANGSDPR